MINDKPTKIICKGKDQLAALRLLKHAQNLNDYSLRYVNCREYKVSYE